MTDDADLSDLHVLRRIHKSHVRLQEPLEIDPVAFRPTREDHEGLSVSYEGETTPEELAGSARQPAANYAVVRLRVRALEALGLSVRRDDADGAPPGHAFIPEINTSDYSDRKLKQKLKDLTHQLAKLASGDIVRHPRFDDE